MERILVRVQGRGRLGDGAAPEATALRSITGRGGTAIVEKETVHIGSSKLFAEVEGQPLPDDLRAEVERLEGEGRTTMVVRKGDRHLGVICLMDRPRHSAARTMLPRPTKA